MGEGATGEVGDGPVGCLRETSSNRSGGTMNEDQAMLGAFRERKETRDEFLALVRQHSGEL